MTVKDGKIIEATEQELYNYWLSRGWDDLFSFPDYLKRCQGVGTVIKENRKER